MIRLLPTLSVRRPVTVVMAFVALVLLGVLAWVRIPLQMMPDGFSISELWVWVPWTDATPQETERSLTLPLEEQLATVPGLRGIRSRSNSNGSSLSLEFNRSTEMDAAYNDVVDRMERAMAELPDEVEHYYIWRFNPSDEPIAWVGVNLPEDLEDPYRVLNDLVVKRLERASGVGKVEAWGPDPTQVYIDFSLDDLMRNRVSLYQVIQGLSGDNFQIPTGRITDRGLVRYVRGLARWEDIDTLRAWPVKEGVTLADVASVEQRAIADLDINHIDGDPGAGLAIYKESGANTVATSRAVEAAMRELEADPRLMGARFFTFFDQGQLIRASLDNLVQTALWGGLFAVIILYVFLREWRMTLLIAACIPFSLLLTVTLLYFTGRTLNLISLMGLMLAVGMVVDNAIVVVESIYERRQTGEERRQAAIDGTSAVGLAILLSTLTTMVVFLPVILMSEDANFSFFMGALGFPVVWALGASLLVALVFTPLSTTFLRGATLPPPPRWILRLEAWYRRALSAVLRHRTDTVMGLLAMGFLTVLVPFKAVGCEGDAEGNLNDFVIRYEVPAQLTLSEREEVVATFEKFVDDHRDAWGVRVHRSRLRASGTWGETNVSLLEDPPEGAMPRDQVVKDARDNLPEIPGVSAQIGWNNDRDNDRSLSIVLRGEDTGTLGGLAEEAKRRLSNLPGVLVVRSDLEDRGSEEVRLRVDRDAAARYGLTAQRVGQTVAFAMRGTRLAPVQWGGREVDMLARFSLLDRSELDRLLDFPITTDTGSNVPLRALVSVEIGRGYGTIRREERTTAFPLTLDLEAGVETGAVKMAVGAAMRGLNLPQGYDWDYGFKDRQDDENSTAERNALLMSVIFVFLIMGVLFDSFVLPLSVLTTIPMALVGVWWALYLTGTPLDVMGGVGLVILVGVVVNNGIVLVDCVTRLRAEGMARSHALVEAGGRRLRPILMTALTTIFGVLPMAAGKATFIGIPYAPLGRVVAGGMIAGTFLTLFVLPFLYAGIDDLRGSGRRWLAWVAGRPPAALEQGLEKTR